MWLVGVAGILWWAELQCAVICCEGGKEKDEVRVSLSGVGCHYQVWGVMIRCGCHDQCTWGVMIRVPGVS